ncbi:hypothetical protein ACB098_06G120200 [Castanea mollissima]
MIETFVFNIATKLLGELVSSAFQEACLVWGVENDLRRLENTLSNVKDELTIWLGQLREVFYDAQDVLNEFECEVLRKQVEEMQGSTTRKVRCFFSSSDSLVFRTKMAHKVKVIRARFYEVAADRAKFHLSPRSDDWHVASDVIGRDQDKENILKHLMDPSDGQSISVVPVVGIGGLGKIALAKLVFNDKKVIEHFEIKCWVCVSNVFVIKQLLVKIIKSIISENCSDLDEEQLQMLLRNNLDGKKFFLVLDNVWNEDRGKWIELRNLLMGGANEIKILVTTHSLTIASMMGTMSPYNLEVLLHEDYVERQHRNLVEIGDAIVKKCKEVPLAVKSLESLLYSKLDKRDWLFVRDNEIYLRVLDLSGSCFEVLPSSIGTMKHLRLLDLSNNCRIHKLPDSIFKLQNMQTLELHLCEKLEESPKDIRYLIKLRKFLMTTKQKSLLGCPSSLQILGLFNCGNLESFVEMMQVCTSLRFLHMNNCGGLISLLPTLKFLTTLEALIIENCEKIDLTEMEDNKDDFPTSLRVLGFIGLP